MKISTPIYYVHSYYVDGQEFFSKKQVQEILGIRHRRTINGYLDTLELPRAKLTWEAVKELLKLKLFLYARMGYHTRKMYRVLKAAGQLEKIFEYLKIDVEQEFRKVQDGYYQRQRTA